MYTKGFVNERDYRRKNTWISTFTWEYLFSDKSHQFYHQSQFNPLFTFFFTTLFFVGILLKCTLGEIVFCFTISAGCTRFSKQCEILVTAGQRLNLILPRAVNPKLSLIYHSARPLSLCFVHQDKTLPLGSVFIQTDGEKHMGEKSSCIDAGLPRKLEAGMMVEKKTTRKTRVRFRKRKTLQQENYSIYSMMISLYMMLHTRILSFSLWTFS